MSELNAESVLASIVELRASIAEQGKRMEQETAELRASIAEQGKRSEQANAELRASIAEQGKHMDERAKRMEQETAELRASIAESTAELRASIAEQGKRFDKVLDELRMNNHKVGELSNKIGHIVEKIVVPRFKGKKIYGAFSTAIAEQKSIKYALSKGFYGLQQPDVMAVRIIDFPKGRSAKAW